MSVIQCGDHSGGAGLELLGPTPADDDTELLVQLVLATPDEPNGIQLRATIRNHTAQPSGTMRVGIAFAHLSDLERALLTDLLAHQPQ